MLKCLQLTYTTRLNGMTDFCPTTHTCDLDTVGITRFILLFITLLTFSFVKLR